MKIAVYGTGGVGGYFGGRLAQAGADVHLIARGDHLDALRQDGLRVRSIYGDFVVDGPVTDDIAEIGPCDHVLFTVKSFDTAAAARELSPSSTTTLPSSHSRTAWTTRRGSRPKSVRIT